MKIVIVNQHPCETLGGSEVQCDLLAEGLQNKGHDILYVAPSNKSRVDGIGVPYAVEQVRRTAADILKAIKAFGPEIVYWRFNKNRFRVVAKGLKPLDASLVFAVSHVNDLRPWIWHRPSRSIVRRLQEALRRRWEHVGLRYVDALTVNNQEHLRYSPISNSHYIPNGMIEESDSFDWPRPFCAWVANMKAAKRPEAFVRLAKELSDVGVDFIMVGHLQDKAYSWLQNSESLPPNLYYLGPKSLKEVNGILSASRLHVHTCLPEGFSNVFIQAWLQGKPSVSLGVDPCGYISEHGLGANANEDWNCFVEEVRRFLMGDELCERVGQQARSFAKKTFSVDTMVSRVEEVLLTVTGRAQ